jgi:hypothetical protein
MGLAAKKQPQVDLGGEILRLRGQIESFIDAKVAQLKAGRDGQSMPVEQLRLMLTHGDNCLCRCAMNLLAEEIQ